MLLIDAQHLFYQIFLFSGLVVVITSFTVRNVVCSVANFLLFSLVPSICTIRNKACNCVESFIYCVSFSLSISLAVLLICSCHECPCHLLWILYEFRLLLFSELAKQSPMCRELNEEFLPCLLWGLSLAILIAIFCLKLWLKDFWQCCYMLIVSIWFNKRHHNFEVWTHNAYGMLSRDGNSKSVNFPITPFIDLISYELNNCA